MVPLWEMGSQYIVEKQNSSHKNKKNRPRERGIVVLRHQEIKLYPFPVSGWTLSDQARLYTLMYSVKWQNSTHSAIILSPSLRQWRLLVPFH
jgi:hypothetical protein